MDQAAVSTPTPVTTLLRPLSLPMIGTHWVEQGGIFLGLLRSPEGDRALILCTDERGLFEDRTWGEYGQTITGADSYFDGRANTAAMAAAGSELAKDIVALDIAGLADWHLPSQAELQIARANASDSFVKGDWYWTSTQYSPSYAWVQGFENGYSDIDRKNDELRAVAVRSFIL